MADTLLDVPLPAKTAVDLYDATAITVGVQINVQNNSTGDVRLFAGATAPTLGVSGSTLLRPGIMATNDDGDAGAWAWSLIATSVQVRIA